MRAVAVLGLVLLAGCASWYPRELHLSKDRDGEDCRLGTGEPAIAACRRILDRPLVSERANVPTRVLVYALRSGYANILGWRLIRAGRPAEALPVAETALDLVERFSRAGPVGQAEGPRLLASMRQRTAAHALAASALMRLRHWEDATGHLREAMRDTWDNALLWGALGVAANQAGHFEESSAAFARAMELDPRYFTGNRRVQRDVWTASKQGRRYDAATFDDELLI
jgi:tetratricopeptide (TPR) repeat protein